MAIVVCDGVVWHLDRRGSDGLQSDDRAEGRPRARGPQGEAPSTHLTPAGLRDMLRAAPPELGSWACADATAARAPGGVAAAAGGADDDPGDGEGDDGAEHRGSARESKWDAAMELQEGETAWCLQRPMFPAGLGQPQSYASLPIAELLDNLLVVASTLRVLLVDSRRPQTPVLAWQSPVAPCRPRAVSVAVLGSARNDAAPAVGGGTYGVPAPVLGAVAAVFDSCDDVVVFPFAVSDTGSLAAMEPMPRRGLRGQGVHVWAGGAEDARNIDAEELAAALAAGRPPRTWRPLRAARVQSLGPPRSLGAVRVREGTWDVEDAASVRTVDLARHPETILG